MPAGLQPSDLFISQEAKGSFHRVINNMAVGANRSRVFPTLHEPAVNPAANAIGVEFSAPRLIPRFCSSVGRVLSSASAFRRAERKKRQEATIPIQSLFFPGGRFWKRSISPTLIRSCFLKRRHEWETLRLANKEKKKKSCAWRHTDCLKVFLSFRVYNYMKTGDGEDSFDLPSFVAKEEKIK